MEQVNQCATKIKCYECGKYFDFLAPHVTKTHQMSVVDYKEKWKIARHIPLSSISHRNVCRRNIKERIRKRELDPTAQIEMMKVAYAKSTKRGGTTELAKNSASVTARRYQIWLKSPAIKPASQELKQEALRRMQERGITNERVKDIADDLKVSVSRLYAWFAKRAN
ncbi:MucR family transcriptional regulator [Pantoea sp. SO10]|uniref:MucR family transcriptional regulator n=1 Tax=Pantoea sp. SO10 TaxID=2575375 RepID=UPI0010C9431F|nr:MucR family transcriptional regulator [Pantoea sp. SO10]QCP60804.1 ROS/MUCR transcriptional regulator domain protein [Pantoea sp. SO10]